MSLPRAPYTATWRLLGKGDDKTPWTMGWSLSLPDATSFDYASVQELHEDLLLWSEPFCFAVLSSGFTCDVSRLLVEGPFTAVGNELFTFSSGARGDPVPAAVAVPVRQIVQAAGSGRPGRFWLPAPAFGDTEFTFQLTAGAASYYSTALTHFFNGVNSINTPAFPNVRFAVIHRRHAGHAVDPPLVQPVDTWVLSRRLGTQKRRMSGVRV